MAHVIHSHNSHPLRRIELPANRPVSLVRTIIRRFRERRELDRVLGLPDYLLKDIGLQRHDIPREALRPMWRA